jgi:membrane protease YdiL (CAAX protease family)
MKNTWLATYILLTYTFSWAIWIPMALSKTVVAAGQGWPTHLLGLLGPALAAILVTATTRGRSGLTELFGRITKVVKRPIWFLILAITASFISLGLLAPHSINDFLTYSGAGSIGWLVVPYVLVVNGFGEEIGWRGYLADALLDHFSRGATSSIIWVVWGIWHLPLFWVVSNFMDLGIGGTIGWAIGLFSGSVLLTWMYDASGSSIFLVAVWHTLFNFSTATTATSGLPAAVSSTLVIVAAVVLLLLPRTWRRKMA